MLYSVCKYCIALINIELYMYNYFENLNFRN